MMFFLAAFVDCLAILVMYTIFIIFLLTYVGADISSARLSIKNAYITIMVKQRSSAAVIDLSPSASFIFICLQCREKKMLKIKQGKKKT